jgi:hypothetical protein
MVIAFRLKLILVRQILKGSPLMSEVVQNYHWSAEALSVIALKRQIMLRHQQKSSMPLAYK